MHTYTYSKTFTYDILKENANISVCNTFKCYRLEAEMAKHLTIQMILFKNNVFNIMIQMPMLSLTGCHLPLFASLCLLLVILEDF